MEIKSDIMYRARTIAHLLELLDDPLGIESEFEPIRSSIRECMPALYELTGEVTPEQAAMMENPVAAFYLMALADSLDGVAGGLYSHYVPEPIQQRIHWLACYFREQLGFGFTVVPADWGA